jgi:TolB-like protein
VAASDGLIEDLAGAILDGASIDWASAESTADFADRSLLHQLQLLSIIAAVQRFPASRLEKTLEESVTPAPAAHQEETPGQWGHLRVLERIGRGAYGEVFRAWDTRLDREVALKLLPATAGNGDPHGSSIIEEGRWLARVRHPNVATIYGAERIENRIGLWMELVKGRTLQQALEQGTTFSASEAVAIGIELCRAAAAVHGAGLLHRDIKAQNAMVADDGRVVLMDFGTGRELNDSSAPALAGTPLYLAPELLSGHEPTVRSDIYSLGVLLFYLLTKMYPVRARRLHDLRLAYEKGETTDIRRVRPDVARKLARIIARAIDRDPDRRYETANDLAADLATLTPGARRVAWTRRLGAAAAVMLVMAGVWELGARQRRWETRPTVLLAGIGGMDWRAGAEGTRAATHVRSIAVLPFKALVPAEADERLQLGLTEGLINQLSRIKTLRIEPVARVRGYGGLDQDPLAAARTLGVEAVLDGHFQQSAGEIHVRSRLLRTRDGISLATNEWREPSRNILNVQSRLADALADALDLTPAERSLIRGQETSSADAFRHYAFGRYHAEVFNVERMQLAEREFREAIRLDPQYARAHAGLALSLTNMVWLGVRKGIDVREPARQAALKAVALDESVGLAHTVLGQIYHYFDYAPLEAQREHLRAVELDDRDVAVLRAYSFFLLHTGAPDHALEVHRRTLELDPVSPLSHRQAAEMLYVARRYDECVAECRRALSLEPGDVGAVALTLGRCLEHQGKQREAVEAWENGRAAANPALAEQFKRVFAARGWTGYWRERMRLAAPNQRVGVGAAAGYARSGDIEEAIRALEHGYESRSLGGFAPYPDYDPLRADPRFQALLVRLGLSQEILARLSSDRQVARAAPADSAR